MAFIGLSSLPDPLLQLIFYYLDSYDQRVFLVLSTQFLQLEEDFSMIDINLTDIISVKSQRLANIRNGYDRIDLHFNTPLETLREPIIRLYQERVEEESRKETHSPPSKERLYDMLFELWCLSYLRSLTSKLSNILTLLERKKLEKLQTLTIYLETQNDNNENLIKLFDLLHQQDRCSYLQLKGLNIRNYDFSNNNIAVRPRLPSFDGFSGLLFLRLTGILIPENPGCGFQRLKDLELNSCTLECEVSDFDGVERLKLEDCEGCAKLPVFKTTRNVHISSRLQEGDNFFTASVLDLLVDRSYKDTIYLDQYYNSRSLSFRVPRYKNDFAVFFMPNKFSDTLRELRIDGFELFLDPLPSNHLRLVEFTDIKVSHAFLQSLRNIENVILCECGEISLESLGSGIKNITIEDCQFIDSSPLQHCEKVTIINCQINHALMLSNVKELILQDCNLNTTTESVSLIVPFISNCQKLEVLNMDFEHFNLHEITRSEFPSLKKIVLYQEVNWKMNTFASSYFQVCLMPKDAYHRYITYLSR